MIIIETEEGLQYLKQQLLVEDCLIVPILKNNNKIIHYSKDELCILYFYFVESKTEFIISNFHSECINYNVVDLMKNYFFFRKKIFCHDSRFIYKFLDDKKNYDVIDVNMMNYLVTNKEIDYESLLTSVHKYYFHFCFVNRISEPNVLIPILKHHEYFSKIRDIFTDAFNNYIKLYSDFKVASGFTYYIKKGFYNIEKNEIVLDKDEAKKFNINKTSLFNNYSLNTVNFRPSNHFNGFNLYSMSKTSGVRKIMKSSFENGYILEIDYNSYYFRLLGYLVKHDLSDIDDVYSFLYKELYNKQFANKQERDDFKSTSFKNIYSDSKSNSEFLNKIKLFKQQIYEEFNELMVPTPLGRYIIKKNFEEQIDENKLLSYYLNSFETERNLIIIDEINKFIYNREDIKLIMYFYDSFLFDIKEENHELINKLVDIAKIDSEKSVNIKLGKNYNEMKSYKYKKYEEQICETKTV